MRIAVVGSGIAGLGAAWALSRVHRVTLYEADDRLGGHSNTDDVEDGERLVPVDTGFIVYNERNYPNLVRLFEAIGVRTEPSEMSFSVSIGGGSYEYKAAGLGVLAQRSNVLRPGHVRMLADILRFSRRARALLAAGSRESLGDYLDRGGYGDAFRRRFLLPMVACIWSSNFEAMSDFPADTLVRFLDNHGLLDVVRPRWRTVSGGSREYVRRVTATIDDVRPGTPVVSIHRRRGEVVVRDASGGEGRFDHVVLATHADVSLRILGDWATIDEREILGAFRYQRNRAVLHRDASLMPVRRRVWASWNYVSSGARDDDAEHVSLTYWMNRLQNLKTRRPVLVTLNPSRPPRSVVTEHTYDHPQFDRTAVDAQGLLPRLQGRSRVWFCGAYSGYGFHEDGLLSGLRVAAALGAPAPWWGAAADEGALSGRLSARP